MKSGDEFELRIDRLATGGDGVGRGPDGRVVFVPWTAPGDRVRVRVTEVRARFARAELLELLQPGPFRVEPLCPVFGQCGGCAWQHLDPAAQRAAKSELIREALARIGGIQAPDGVDVRPSPQPYGYRARARVHVQGGRVGFWERRSQALCATARCPVLVPELEAALTRMAERPPREGSWDLVAGDDGRVQITPHRRAARGARARMRLEGGEELGLSPGVFSQANALLRGALAQAVEEAAGEGACALELYAGAGLFTVGLARRFSRVMAVEGHAPAARDLRANLRRAGREHVEVVCAPVEEALEDLVRSGLAPEVVVLDPPRQGLARGAAARLVALAAPRVVYVSCDPATLARDLAALTAGGYALGHLEGFDLFPQTSHVEAVALLERERQAGGPGEEVGVPPDGPKV